MKNLKNNFKCFKKNLIQHKNPTLHNKRPSIAFTITKLAKKYLKTFPFFNRSHNFRFQKLFAINKGEFPSYTPFWGHSNFNSHRIKGKTLGKKGLIIKS